MESLVLSFNFCTLIVLNACQRKEKYQKPHANKWDNIHLRRKINSENLFIINNPNSNIFTCKMYNLFGISEDTHLVKTYFTEQQYPVYSLSMYGDILSFFFFFTLTLKSVNEILWCYNSSELWSGKLLHSSIYSWWDSWGTEVIQLVGFVRGWP